MNDRFHRQVLMFGEVGQARLQAQHIGIVGLGGIGVHVAQQLSHLGVSTFLLVDPDCVAPQCVVVPKPSGQGPLQIRYSLANAVYREYASVAEY